jgi:hypothetical protein
MCPALPSEGEDYAIYSKPKHDAIKLYDNILYNANVSGPSCLNITTGAYHLEVNKKHLSGLSGVVLS